MQNFSDVERTQLRRLAGFMIPADAEYDVPGADDPEILGEIVDTAGRDTDAVKRVLRELDAQSDGDFAAIDERRAEQVAREFLSRDAHEVGALSWVVLRCYYRDDRVMRSLGMEPRPPFPKGFVVDQGDWSLLDPVRRRPKMYREVT